MDLHKTMWYFHFLLKSVNQKLWFPSTTVWIFKILPLHFIRLSSNFSFLTASNIELHTTREIIETFLAIAMMALHLEGYPATLMGGGGGFLLISSRKMQGWFIFVTAKFLNLFPASHTVILIIFTCKLECKKVHTKFHKVSWNNIK
jgi:hypothetical protein